MIDWTVVFLRPGRARHHGFAAPTAGRRSHAMSAFLRTLFGDAGTVAVVALVMAAEALSATAGLAAMATFAVPALVLAGTAWLASR
jgi:hypothetical protein